MKNVNNFQIEKFNLRVLLSIWLIFGQFQPGVAYKAQGYILSPVAFRLHAFFISNIKKCVIEMPQHLEYNLEPYCRKISEMFVLAGTISEK